MKKKTSDIQFSTGDVVLYKSTTYAYIHHVNVDTLGMIWYSLTFQVPYESKTGYISSHTTMPHDMAIRYMTKVP